MSDRVIENVIEWLDGQKTATGTFSQKKHINKIKKMAEERPDLVQIDWENADGSIVAHFPVSMVKLRFPNEISPESRAKMVENLRRNT